MSDPTRETPDLAPESLDFQILVAGTVIFLIVLFWLTNVPHANTHEARIAMAASRAVRGIQILGCYSAFVCVLFAHRLLRRKRRSGDDDEV